MLLIYSCCKYIDYRSLNMFLNALSFCLRKGQTSQWLCCWELLPWRSWVRPLTLQTLGNLSTWHDPINQASVRFPSISELNSAVYLKLDGLSSVIPWIPWPLCFCIQQEAIDTELRFLGLSEIDDLCVTIYHTILTEFKRNTDN